MRWVEWTGLDWPVERLIRTKIDIELNELFKQLYRKVTEVLIMPVLIPKLIQTGNALLAHANILNGESAKEFVESASPDIVKNIASDLMNRADRLGPVPIQGCDEFVADLHHAADSSQMRDKLSSGIERLNRQWSLVSYQLAFGVGTREKQPAQDIEGALHFYQENLWNPVVAMRIGAEMSTSYQLAGYNRKNFLEQLDLIQSQGKSPFYDSPNHRGLESRERGHNMTPEHVIAYEQALGVKPSGLWVLAHSGTYPFSSESYLAAFDFNRFNSWGIEQTLAVLRVGLSINYFMNERGITIHDFVNAINELRAQRGLPKLSSSYGKTMRSLKSGTIPSFQSLGGAFQVFCKLFNLNEKEYLNWLDLVGLNE